MWCGAALLWFAPLVFNRVPFTTVVVYGQRVALNRVPFTRLIVYGRPASALETNFFFAGGPPATSGVFLKQFPLAARQKLRSQLLPPSPTVPSPAPAGGEGGDLGFRIPPHNSGPYFGYLAK